MTSDWPDMNNASTVRAHANLRLPHSDRAPRIARAFVAENLQSWQLDDLIEPATLVVSEVVTNAVIHRGPTPRRARSERRRRCGSQ